MVILEKTEDMCSVAFTEDHKQQVLLRARSSVLLRYTVIPLKAEAIPIQVTAIARFSPGQDAIRKNLNVVVRIFLLWKTSSKSWVNLERLM